MITGILIALTLVVILLLPLVVKGEVIWHEFALRCQIKLYMGPAPVACLRAAAALEPLTLRATLNGVNLRKRRPPRKKPAKHQAFYFRTLANAVRCRKLSVQFDLGIAQDAAATAIGYGTLSTLTNMALAWAKSHGAAGCSGSVMAHFDESRYEGTIEGIIQTNLAHIMLGAVKAWRNR